MGLRGHPDDISRAAVFLLAPESSFIAGTVLFLDGGHDALIRPDNF